MKGKLIFGSAGFLLGFIVGWIVLNNILVSMFETRFENWMNQVEAKPLCAASLNAYSKKCPMPDFKM